MTSRKRKDRSAGRREFLKATGLAAGSLLLATSGPPASLAATPSARPMPGGKAIPNDAAPPEKQVLRIPTQDNRFVCTGIGGYTVIHEVAGNFFEKLVKYNNDWDLEPQLAQSSDISPDGKMYTYHLRPGLTWDDGTPLTAHDVVTHFRVQLDPKNPSPVAWFWYPLLNGEEVHKGQKPVDQLGIKALSANTVQMTLKNATPYWNHLMAYMDSQPYAKHMWDKHGDKMYSSAESSRMSGPWKMSEWTKGKRIVLEARDNYKGAFPGYLKRIEVAFADSATLWAAYQRGEIDIIQNVNSPGDVRAIRNDAQLSKEHHAWPEWRAWYLLFHTQDGPFKDLNVRKAIAHAIDREALCGGPLKDFATPSYTIVPPGFPGNQTTSDKVRDLQKFDPDAARKLLDKGGFAKGSGFPKLEMWLRGAAQGSSYVAAAEFIQSALKDVLGMRLEIRPEETKTYMEAMGQYKIPITLINWGFDFPDPYDMIGIPFRSRYPSPGGRTDWKNAEFDKLIDASSAITDMKVRYESLRKAEQVLLDDVGAVALWNPIIHQLWKPWVKGFRATASGDTQYTFKKPMMHELYIAKH